MEGPKKEESECHMGHCKESLVYILIFLIFKCLELVLISLV